MSDWVKRFKDLAEAIGQAETASTEEATENLLRVFIPTPENSPLANLMSLPEHEVGEWMARQQYKRMH